MKLLITGGSGFLGRRTVAYFQELGWQVLAPNHQQLDITNKHALQAWFSQNQPAGVIHTAAISSTGLCEQQPVWSETINVTGAVNLANVCREYGAKLVFCSSDQVYAGSILPGPHKETETLLPGNVYGRQKLLAEQQCLTVLPETVCLRLSWMYARQDLPGDHSHFLAKLKTALNDVSLPLCWPVHDYRNLTDVDLVIQNLAAALRLPGGVWNFGSENHSSTFTTVKTVFEELGMESALQRLTPNEEAFAENPRDISMDLHKLRTAGIHFPTTKDGLLAALKAAL